MCKFCACYYTVGRSHLVMGCGKLLGRFLLPFLFLSFHDTFNNPQSFIFSGDSVPCRLCLRPFVDDLVTSVSLASASPRSFHTILRFIFNHVLQICNCGYRRSLFNSFHLRHVRPNFIGQPCCILGMETKLGEREEYG